MSANLNPATITGRINAKALEIIGENPEGIRWAELQRQIKAYDSTLHPKTVNGCVWQLADNFPDKVYKPSKGLFRLVKYREP